MSVGGQMSRIRSDLFRAVATARGTSRTGTDAHVPSLSRLRPILADPDPGRVRPGCVVRRGMSLAQAPAPETKDSTPKAKPKSAVVTTSASPAEVRPGGTVVYKVTAKLNPGYHIYNYSKVDNEDGPKNTRFDLFDNAGLTVAGDWTASKPATKKKEPAFPELESVSSYADEVTWSIPLKVPADAPPGKKVIRCQAAYQVCNAQSCSFPGRWTLPDAVVTVLPAGQTQTPPAAAPVAAQAPPAAPAVAVKPAEPKEKDSSPRAIPGQIVVTSTLNVKEGNPGDIVRIFVTAQLDPGWHVYDYAKSQPDDGPRATQFDVFQNGGLVPVGEWAASTPPQFKTEPAFNNLPVAYFENKVTWILPLQVPEDAAPGPRTIQLQIGCQVCNDMSCLPPARWTLPAMTYTVLTKGTVTTSCDDKAARLKAVLAAGSKDSDAKTPTSPAVAGSYGPVKTEKVVSEVEKTAQQGIIPLMIASALGGLLALVMPCVWPMVPITVNFFVKQGQSKKAHGGSTTGLAVTYCLAIIGVFTTVGVLASFFVSATALSKLANNPWLNFGVAGLFFAFGLSLLGLFEISLPTALLNASARGESRGGLLGVVFMALTLTITSFTCTFPVVGGLLVMAAGGQFFYPIIGLATFSTVLALPFFLLALAPGLLSKMPKSGDWMNSVKVVGGLVEIGAAFKFLNTAEIAFVTPENAWIDAQFVLTTWVVLAAVCGFYLLGFFRTNHDHGEVQIGPGRMIVGTSFLGMALFLAPALFGRPPQSLIWDRLVAGLLPPDVGRLSVIVVRPSGRKPARRRWLTTPRRRLVDRSRQSSA